ncbi:MAG: hypothetical protein JXL97_11390 [Bacteroidales bacterium]|nr:hypothetical protein [Bacteroidales bacterium]
MQRIIVIGCGGAGKSTFSKKLHVYLKEHELIHLDSVYWRPNWIRTPEDEWKEVIKNLVAKEKWIIDGNHDSTLDIRLERADTVIFIDRSRYVCMRNSVKRTLIGKIFGIERADMTKGCKERFDRTFYNFVWTYNKTLRPKYLELFKKIEKEKQIYILRNNFDANVFLSRVRAKISKIR